MSGWFGGQSGSAKTDRGNQLAATQGEWNIFNYGMPAGQQGQSTGTNVLSSALQPIGQAQDYFSKLLNPGRTDVAQRSAPAINATLAGADAQRQQNAQFGTGRSGGTAATNANAGAATAGHVDDIINSNLVGGQQQGAQGLLQSGGATAGVGADFLSNALSLLGLGANADTNILSNATGSRAESYKENQAAYAQVKQIVGNLAAAFL